MCSSGRAGRSGGPPNEKKPGRDPEAPPNEKKPGLGPKAPPRLSGPESVSGASSILRESAGSVAASEKLWIDGRAADSGHCTCFVYRGNPICQL